MAAYGYRNGDYTTSSWISPQTSSYGGSVTGPGITNPAGYFSDGYSTKPYSSPANTWGTQSTPIHHHDHNSHTNWRQPPYTMGHSDCSTGHTECSNHHIKNDFWSRPSHDNYTQGNSRGFDDYYRRNDRTVTANKTGGWDTSRHGNGGWSTTSDSTLLSEPTNSIGGAVETLKEAAAMSNPSSAGYGYGGYGQSVDMDATRRYGNFKLTSRPPFSGVYYWNINI